MRKYWIVVSGILLLIGCSTNPTNHQISTTPISDSNQDLTKLSYVKAYLLIGNVKQAQSAFDSIEKKQLLPQSKLVQAELKAASGDIIGAQQSFLSFIQNKQSVENFFSDNLLNYFCKEKMWPALQNYGEALISSTPLNATNIAAKNSAITQIGMCFYGQQNWDETDYWLSKVAANKETLPIVHLVLARIKIEQNQFLIATDLMQKYETKKTEVDAKSLWTALEVYRALEQPDKVNTIGELMRSLFPYNQYTRKYILLTKRGLVPPINTNQQTSSTVTDIAKKLKTTDIPLKKQHIIRKGENLFQLSKRYGVTVDNLLLWNPELVATDIPLGSVIKIMPN